MGQHYGQLSLEDRSETGFLLLGVALHAGQKRIRPARVPITCGTEPVHLKGRDDPLQKLDERVQHRCQPALRKRWVPTPFARVRACVVRGALRQQFPRPHLGSSIPRPFGPGR